MKTQYFNSVVAPKLAGQVGVTTPDRGIRSPAFAYFADRERFLVVAGGHEETDVNLAFALGLTYRGDRRLVLVLPNTHAFPTLQRAPWFNAEARPEVWLHDGETATPHNLPTQAETVHELTTVLKQGQTFEEELRHAATPKHLGMRTPAVYDLVEWATTNPHLDASHRRGERAWHCMGQKVLSIRATRTGLAVIAGVHFSAPAQAPEAVEIANTATLDVEQLASIKQQVEAGVNHRLTGLPPIHRPDEHWLQAVIRLNPSLVGVEQPALRELPAWRPGTSRRWGRGYIDLIGVDGHGDVRVVETKVADNQDDLLVLQGLDYYVWAKAYRDVLLQRLGAPKRSALEIHYVIGATAVGPPHLSKYARAQAMGLDEGIRWRFQIVHDWYPGTTDPGPAHSRLLGPGELLP